MTPNRPITDRPTADDAPEPQTSMPQGNSTLWILAGVVALVFLGIAVVGSIVVSHRMDQVAAESGSSTGDKAPNGIQEQEIKPSARGPSTSGSSTQGAVPPATKDNR
jgi:hypothetical protein